VSTGPVRNPKRHFADTYTGSVNTSRDNHRSVPFEALPEQDWQIRTDVFCLDLRSIEAQLMEVEYRFDRRKRTWTPDLLRRRKRPERCQDPPADVVEVKPLLSSKLSSTRSGWRS
jgi:hypothetical protein